MSVIDVREAQRFLDILNPSGSPLIFQTFDDNVNKNPAYVTTRTGKLDTYVDKLTSLNEKGAGIFVTVNRSRTNRRVKSDIISARAVWQEDDIGTDRIPDLEPSLVIETSAGKYHRYWLIQDGTEDLYTWEKVQQTLVDEWDSDPNVKDLCRVMRIPGFYHNKGEPFRTKIISDTENIKYYEWDEIVSFFMPHGEKTKQQKYDEREDEKFDPVHAIKEVLKAENFHGSLQSLAGRYANMNMGKTEVVMMLKALIMGAGGDPERRERAYNEVEAQVDWAFKETAKESYTHPGLKNEEIEITTEDEYLDLEYPPGNMGKIAKNVEQFMRYPSKEIATEAALHCVNVFAASSYVYDGVPNHRRTVLLAGQGRGKNVINTYMERVCTAMCRGNMANPMYLEFVGNGDYTSPKQMHLELQEFGSRSMISSEAGHMQATKAGDRVGIKGYENQTLMNDPYTLRRPPRRQNVVKGEDGMTSIMSICMSIVHESVLSNYAKLFTDREAYNDGTISRTNFLFINPVIDKKQKNIRSGNAQVDEDMLGVMKLVADTYLERGDPLHKHTGMAKMQEVHCEPIVDEILDSLEDLYIDKKNASDNEVETAIYARKIVLIKQTCKLLAVIDNPVQPIVTKEHLDWAVMRSDKVSSNLMFHASQGGLSGAMPQLIIAAIQWCSLYLRGKKRNKPRKAEVKNNTVHAKIFRRDFFGGQQRILALLKQEPAYKYKDNSFIYEALIVELEQTSHIEILRTKDVFGISYSSNKSLRDFKVLHDIDLRTVSGIRDEVNDSAGGKWKPEYRS